MLARFLLGLGLIAAGSVCADEAFTVRYRSLGRIDVTYAETLDGSRTTFACVSPEKARVLASKRRADLLGYGDLTADGDVLTLDGIGSWTLAVEGSSFVETFASGGGGRKRLRPSQPSTFHPRWMDCFDAFGPALWDIGGGQVFDLPGDFDWLKSLGMGFCGVRPSMERCVAPGKMDDTVFVWQDAMARRYDLTYRHLLFPSEPLTLGWNRDPLPYVTPAEDFVIMPYYFNLGSMTHGQGLAVPVPQLDKYIFAIRYGLAKRMAADDSRLIGWHGCDEMGGASIHALMSVARTPHVVAAWKARHPDGGAVPDAKDFLGWNPKTDLDLRGGWELKTMAGEWIDFAWNDPMLSVAQYYPYRNEFRSPSDLPEKRKTYLRRRFTLTGPKAARRYLHVARNRMRQPSAAAVNFVWTVRVNGREAPMTECLFSDCWDVGSLLKDGENEIEINSWGQSIPGYVFLNGTRAVNYPHFSKALNRRWYEAIEFITELKVEKVEGDARAMRAGDPVRPLKLMATRSFLDHILPLCRKYGAYLHDTGLAGGCWAPMTGAGVAHSHGIPFSCEQGEPPRKGEQGVIDFRKTVTLYLNYANDAADFVFAIQNYRKNPFVKAWMEANLPLLHSIGKFTLPQQKVAVLRTCRQDRYGLDQHWNFDVARGPLQQLGRSFVYLESCDLADPSMLERYPVIFDCATLVMTEREAAAIRAYVERGGTFVAQHHTGLHTFEEENARPLEKAMTGLSSAARGRFIRLRENQWNDMKTLGPILDTLAIVRESRSNVWGTRMESKNGVYDIYLSSHIDAPHMKDGTNTIVVSAAFCRESRPAFVRDFGAKGHPEVPIIWKDGAFAVPDAAFEPYATRLYAAPSATPGRAALRWIRAQSVLWQEVASVPPPEPIESDPDFLALDEEWTMEANGETRSVDKPQTFAALGLSDNATVMFRKTLQLPKDWCGRDLQFVFDAQGWFWGIAPKGELKVRGKGVSVDARFQVAISQTKAFDIRSEDGKLEIALTVDGTKLNPRTPAGVTGVFYLRRLPSFKAEYPISEAYACTDYGVRQPVKVGEKMPHRFFELRFPTPEKGERFYLKSEGRLGGFFLNGRAVETRNGWMKVLDVTNLLRRDGRPNVLYWLPEKGIKFGAAPTPIDDPLPFVSLAVQ